MGSPEQGLAMAWAATQLAPAELLLARAAASQRGKARAQAATLSARAAASQLVRGWVKERARG